MDFTRDTLDILVILLPGFLSSTLLDTIIVRRDKSNLTKVFEALSFSLVIYAGAVVMTNILPGALNPEFDETSIPLPLPTYSAGQLTLIVGLALLIPILIGVSITHDIHMKIFRSLRVTNRTSRESVWSDVFAEQHDRSVIVNCKDGVNYFGWPLYYSDTFEEGTIYLFEPATVDQDQNSVDMGCHGILIPRHMIDTIQFAYDPNSNKEVQNAGRTQTNDQSAQSGR